MNMKKKLPKRTPKSLKRIRRVSTNMRKLKTYYRELRDEFLAAHNVCEVHGDKCAPTEIHHKRGRTSTLLIDARFFAAVCSGGHAWIHDRIEDARADGLMCEKGTWCQAPEDNETKRLRALIKEIKK